VFPQFFELEAGLGEFTMLYFLGNSQIYSFDGNLVTPAILPIMNSGAATPQFVSFAIRDVDVTAGPLGAVATVLYGATADGHIYQYTNTNKTFVEVNGSPISPANPLNGLAVDEEGNLWASGNNGVYFYDANTALKLMAPQGGVEANGQIAVTDDYLFIGNNTSDPVGLDIWNIKASSPAVSLTKAGSVASHQCAVDTGNGVMSFLPPGLMPLAMTIDPTGYFMTIAWSQWSGLALGGYQGRAVATRLQYDVESYIENSDEPLACQWIPMPAGRQDQQLWGIVPWNGTVLTTGGSTIWNPAGVVSPILPYGIKFLQSASAMP
jgi:hypothetical protein